MAQLTISSKTLPESAPSHTTQTIVIPVANPNTCPPLIEIAEKLLKKSGGRIILLMVITDDTYAQKRKIATLRRFTNRQQQVTATIKFDLVIRENADVAQTILDVAKRYRADLILLGLSYSIRGQVELGRIVERVGEQAPCDVAVYRSPIRPYTDRVVIPVGGSIASKVILKMGMRLAEGYQYPCETLHVYSNIAEGEARSHVENLLVTLPDHDRVNVNVVHGINAADSVLTWSNENDILVIGFSERSRLEKWLYGDTAQRILDRARGPVLMVWRANDNAEIQSLANRRFSWLRPLLTETEQEHVIWLAKDTVLPTLDYFVLLVVAAVLASLGLLLNSSAVVIGAMLVAPLMQPIIALGIGLCTARLNLMRKAIVTVLLSLLVVLGISAVTGFLIAPDSATKEMLARAYPSLLDAGVALASGFIGAYATARKDIPAALAGVAISAALVPPICTVGLSIALFEPRLAIGAGLLFLTNLVSITVVAGAVFFWMGMRPTRLDNQARRVRYVSLLTGIACVLMLIGGSLNFTQRPTVERVSETRLRTALEPAELVDFQITNQDPMTVVAVIRTTQDIPPESVKMAEVMLTEDLDTEVRLRLVVQQVLDSYMYDMWDTAEAGN